MSQQPTSFVKILCSDNLSHQLCQNSSLPLSRDLDMDHILELHCSSLHHTKIQARSTKSNSIFQKKHTTSQIVEQVETYFSLVLLSAMQDSSLPNQQAILDLKLKKHPKELFFSVALPIRINITMQVSILIRIILYSILDCTLQVPRCMLCNQVSMSRIRQELDQVIHNKACVWSFICQAYQ